MRDDLRELFWRRHSNPWSGGTRVLAAPLLVYAIYARRRRVLAATLAFLAVNPVLFPEPDRTDNWLSRGVLAERWWYERGGSTFGRSYPEALNVLGLPAFGLTLYAAYRRKPAATIAGTAAFVALKLLFVDALVRHRAAETSRGEAADHHQ